MTFTCYEPAGLASVMTIDLKTKQVINHSQKPGSYNECEGIFPGGKYTCVEADSSVINLAESVVVAILIYGNYCWMAQVRILFA